MPNDNETSPNPLGRVGNFTNPEIAKEKTIRHMQKELAGLARESIARQKQLDELEAEVIAMHKQVTHWMPLPKAPSEQNVDTCSEVPSVLDDPEVERERELDRQMKLHDVYPTIVCQKCGLAALALPENAHKKQFKVSTWYPLLCECCGKKKSCTESRDFGYPDFRNVRTDYSTFRVK